MKHTFELSGETGILHTGGSLTIEHAEELKAAITEALASASRLTIDLSAAETVDLCFLQLLCSAHRTAVKDGKCIVLANAGEAFVESIRETGYLRHVGCMHDPAHGCLWAGKEEQKPEDAV